MSKPVRYYERFSRMPFEEDMFHEFKGHRNFCVEEIPIWALMKDEFGKSSRKPISRNLCGFLNTGHGGTVYCGVVDDGIVHGLTLTQLQKEHIVGSIRDLMKRFSPPVPSHRYKVRFVPVIGSGVAAEEREEMLAFKAKECIDPELKKKKHIFRGAEYCWCDQDSIARYKNGMLTSEYVIEVTVLPWNPDNKLNVGLGNIYNLHPIYASDQGEVYFRRQASLCKYTLQEISRMTFYETEKRKNEIISRLKKKIAKFESSRKKQSDSTGGYKTKPEVITSKPQAKTSLSLPLSSSSTPHMEEPLVSKSVLSSSLFSLPSRKTKNGYSLRQESVV